MFVILTPETEQHGVIRRRAGGSHKARVSRSQGCLRGGMGSTCFRLEISDLIADFFVSSRNFVLPGRDRHPGEGSMRKHT